MISAAAAAAVAAAGSAAAVAAAVLAAGVVMAEPSQNGGLSHVLLSVASAQLLHPCCHANPSEPYSAAHAAAE
jgi:hypothetical protein